MHRVTYAALRQTYAKFHVQGRGLPVQININQFIEQSLTTEQRIGAELIKSLGLDGYAMDGLSLLDIFGAPGNSAMTSSAGRDIEQIRGWNHTAILAKALQFTLGSVGVFCPLPTAEAISAHYGEEYAAASRFTGMEQYGVPENWVQSPRHHRVAKLMKKPHPWCDESQMLFQMAQQVEVHGVCYFLILPNQAGLPSEMWIIPKVNITPLSPSLKFPEGSYRVGNLSRVSIGNTTERNPESHQEALSRISNKEYSARWVIPVGLPSIVYSDDFLNMSAAIADALDTDTQIHQSRRKTLSKQMTNGPRLEPLPGTDFQASERDKLLETFESQNLGPENQGRPWMSPKGVKVVDDSHSAREMEYTDSANQSRDHVMGQRLMPSKLLGLGEGGAYAEIIGIIKSNNRNVLQPLMRILSGQLTIGLQRYFDAPQDDFMVLIQAGAIDDPEQKMREWNMLIGAKTITKGQILKAFNLPPFGDERDDEIAGVDPAPAGGQEQPGGISALLQGAGKVPEKGIKGGEIGPEKPGVGAAVPPEATETEKSAPNVFGGLTRQQFVRNRKAVMETLQQFENGTIRERTAIATLKTLGLSSEQATEFVDSVKEDESAALPTPVAEEQKPVPPVAEAMFSRMLAPTSIDLAASTAQTSGTGDLRLPRDEEIKTGAYKKGRFRIAGLAIAIENPARSKRSGVDESGKPWSAELNSHYGYIMGSTGFDKDQVDVYFPEYTEPTFDGMVYVINQANSDGTFDEHKVVIGCNSKTAAKGEYLSNYQDGWKSRIMSIVPLTMTQFKRWLFDPVDGPVAGELMPAMALQYMSIVTEQGAMPVPLTTKSVNYDDRLKALHERRGEDTHGVAKTESAQELERANLIADILVGAFGDDAEQMLADGHDFGMLTKMFSKLWDETKYRRHPRGARFGGRFAPKNSPEAVTAVHGAIDEALRGARSEESASELVDLLSNLTLTQLREVKDKYQMSASGRTKKDLVAKIAARLDSGRRAEAQAPAPEPVPAPAPAPVAVTPQMSPEVREALRQRMYPIITDDELTNAERQYERGVISGDEMLSALDAFDQRQAVLEEETRAIIERQNAELNAREAARAAEAEAAVQAAAQAETARAAAAQAAVGQMRPTPAQLASLDTISTGDAWIITQETGRGTVITRTGDEWAIIRSNGDVSTAIPAFGERLSAIVAEGGAAVMTREAAPAPAPAPAPTAAPVEPPTVTESQIRSMTNHGRLEAHMVTTGPDRGSVVFRNQNGWNLVTRDGALFDSRHVSEQDARQMISDGAAAQIGISNRVSQPQSSAPDRSPARDRGIETYSYEGGSAARRRLEQIAANMPAGMVANIGIEGDPPSGRLRALETQLADAGYHPEDVFNGIIIRGSRLTSEESAPAPAPVPTHADENRLANLRRNLPSTMNISTDRNGTELLVHYQGNEVPLPSQITGQLAVIEQELRNHGHSPDNIAAGRTPAPAPAPAPVQAPAPAPRGSKKKQLEDIGAAFLDKITPDADGNLIKPRVSKAKLIVSQQGDLPEWTAIAPEERRNIEEHWRAATRKEMKNSATLNRRWKSDAESEAQAYVAGMTITHIANEIHPTITKVPGYENATVADVATMVRTFDTTARQLADEYREKTKASEIETRLDGRKSWLKAKFKAELASREASTSHKGWKEYASVNGLLDHHKNPDIAAKLTQFGLTMRDLPSMIGAPDNVTFHVSMSYDGGINLSSSGDVSMDRTIHRDSDGRLVVHNNSFFLDDDMPKGTGLEILANAVGYSKSKGVYKFYTNPCRSEGYTRSDGTFKSGMVGYAVWPQFGYDAPISEIRNSTIISDLRREFPNAQTIRDVYDTPGGQAWWWKNGHSIGKAEFFMEDGSRNLKAMQKYMASKKAARARVKAGK